MGFYPFVPPSTSPSGPAGGVLSGTYPNPGLAAPLTTPGGVIVGGGGSLSVTGGSISSSGSVVSTGSFVQANTGSIDVAGSGFGFAAKEGTNCKQGTAVLVAGSVVVANTSVTANSRILLTSNADGGTPGFVRVSARTAGTSFTITSSSGTDTSTIAYEIFEPG